MKEKEVKPNEVTFNSLIDVCVRCNRPEKGWKLLEEMETSGLIPDSFTYSTIIKGMHRSYGGNNEEQLNKAFELLSRIKAVSKVKPDEILYNCLMDACVRFHSTDKALSVFDEMTKSGICPSSITYGILIKAYGQSGNLSKALSTFATMKREGKIPNTVTYGCLIDACIRNGNLPRGLEIYETMKKDGVEPNTIVYTTLIKGFSKNRDLKSALEIYERMKKDTKNRPNVVTYNSLLNCCVSCNEISTLEKIFVDMSDAKIFKILLPKRN